MINVDKTLLSTGWKPVEMNEETMTNFCINDVTE